MLDAIERFTRADVDGPDLLRGAVAGAAGGLVGSVRMVALLKAWEKFNEKVAEVQPPRDEGRDEGDADPLPARGDRVQADAVRETAATAVRVARRREPEGDEVEVGAAAVHGLTGVVAGALYGAASEYVPAVSRGYGVPLAIGTYLLGRNAGLSLAGLAPRPDRQARADHLAAAASHLAYGVFTELVRRRLRKALRRD